MGDLEVRPFQTQEDQVSDPASALTSPFFPSMA